MVQGFPKAGARVIMALVLCAVCGSIMGAATGAFVMGVAASSLRLDYATMGASHGCALGLLTGLCFAPVFAWACFKTSVTRATIACMAGTALPSAICCVLLSFLPAEQRGAFAMFPWMVGVFGFWASVLYLGLVAGENAAEARGAGGDWIPRLRGE